MTLSILLKLMMKHLKLVILVLLCVRYLFSFFACFHHRGQDANLVCWLKGVLATTVSDFGKVIHTYFRSFVNCPYQYVILCTLSFMPRYPFLFFVNYPYPFIITTTSSLSLHYPQNYPYPYPYPFFLLQSFSYFFSQEISVLKI